MWLAKIYDWGWRESGGSENEAYRVTQEVYDRKCNLFSFRVSSFLSCLPYPFGPPRTGWGSRMSMCSNYIISALGDLDFRQQFNLLKIAFSLHPFIDDGCHCSLLLHNPSKFQFREDVCVLYVTFKLTKAFKYISVLWVNSANRSLYNRPSFPTQAIAWLEEEGEFHQNMLTKELASPRINFKRESADRGTYYLSLHLSSVFKTLGRFI